MSLSLWLALPFLLVGSFFFLAGTVGLLRFPDVYTRLHALTKADNLGLGFIVAGLLLLTESWTEGLQLLFIWLLAITAGGTLSQLIAQTALGRDGKTKSRP